MISVSFLAIHLFLEQERFEFIRDHLERSFGFETTVWIYGCVITLVFPGFIFMQNFGMLFCLSISNYLWTSSEDIILISKARLQENFTILKSVSVFVVKQSKRKILFGYFGYYLAPFMIIPMFIFFKSEIILCSSFGSKYNKSDVWNYCPATVEYHETKAKTQALNFSLVLN